METSEEAEDRSKLLKLLEHMWSIVYPAIKSLSTNLTAPEEALSLAADFVIQSAENTARGGLKMSKEEVWKKINWFLLKVELYSSAELFRAMQCLIGLN